MRTIKAPFAVREVALSLGRAFYVAALLIVFFIFIALPGNAFDRCTGVCQYCVGYTPDRGCGRCGVDEKCMANLSAPKFKQKRVRIPQLDVSPKLVKPAN
jgi:hypothetical protein